MKETSQKNDTAAYQGCAFFVLFVFKVAISWWAWNLFAPLFHGPLITVWHSVAAWLLFNLLLSTIRAWMTKEPTP